MHTTNYAKTFITVSGDCPAKEAATPPKPDSVAGMQLSLLLAVPYAMTSDDLLFAVHARRAGIGEADLASGRAAFFSKPMACLRASPLVKTYGWGVHHDAAGRIAAVPLGGADYAALAADPDMKVVAGMRSKRA